MVPFQWQRLKPVLAGLGVIAVAAVWLAVRDRGVSAETAFFPYPATAASTRAPCPAPGSDTRSSETLRTPAGISVTVRAPRNYDPRYRHFLLVVYAPAGADRFASERLTQLTFAATRAGFIVAYADHATMAARAIGELGRIPDIVGRDWCIDPARVFLTGHSDGGTVATALALASRREHPIAGIAPSAAGFAAADLAAFDCPLPTPVLVMHGAADRHFPGFGRQAAEWWARCNRCDVTATEQRSGGCIAWRACAPGGATVYCEGDGGHLRWPNRNDTVVDFFNAAAAARPM
jgi:polyhydroxybutyrate depolymerase